MNQAAVIKRHRRLARTVDVRNAKRTVQGFAYLLRLSCAERQPGQQYDCDK